jgi:homoserine dehydrogenase
VAQYSSILGRHGISIASLMQKEDNDGSDFVPVVLVTHRTVEKKIRAALAEIDALPTVGDKTIMLRIEEQE